MDPDGGGGGVHGSAFESLAYACMCSLLIVFFLHTSNFIFLFLNTRASP